MAEKSEIVLEFLVKDEGFKSFVATSAAPFEGAIIVNGKKSKMFALIGSSIDDAVANDNEEITGFFVTKVDEDPEARVINVNDNFFNG